MRLGEPVKVDKRKARAKAAAQASPPATTTTAAATAKPVKPQPSEQSALNDPKILTSVKSNRSRANAGEGPSAVSQRLSRTMGRDVHFCDMNVAPTPRIGTSFPMLANFNGAAVSVEDLDLALQDCKWDDWYRKYPRIQCQKRTTGQSSAVLEEQNIEREFARRAKQIAVEVQRFNNRMEGTKANKGATGGGKKKRGGKSLARLIAKRRLEAKKAKEARDEAQEDQKIVTSVKALLQYGRLDGGSLEQVDAEWVRVPNPDLEQGMDGEEASEEEARDILRTLKLAANKGPGPARDKHGDGGGSGVEDDATGASDEECSGDSDEEYDEDILYKEGELTIFDLIIAHMSIYGNNH